MNLVLITPNIRSLERRCGLLALGLFLGVALHSSAADSTSNRPPARPTVTNSPSRLDYASFSIITSRNIFNPHRLPGIKETIRTNYTRPSRVDAFALVGTMAYDKGTFAFFDGASSEYRKVLTNSDMIAGYKISGIEPNLVKLVSGTNEIQMPVGMQLRRENGGAWHLAAASESDFGSRSDRSDRSFRRSRRDSESGATATSGGTAAAESDNGDEGDGPVVMVTSDAQVVLGDLRISDNGGTNAATSAPAGGDPNENPVLRAMRLRREQENGR
jgi:hypothetical protein